RGQTAGRSRTPGAGARPRRAGPARGEPRPRPAARPGASLATRASKSAPGADTPPFRAGRRADLHGRLSPGGAEHAFRERPWREPSRGPAQTAVDTTVGLDGEVTAQPDGPRNRHPGTARPGSRAHARAPFSERPGLQSGRGGVPIDVEIELLSSGSS